MSKQIREKCMGALLSFFSKGKRGGAWLVRLGRLLQAEKGLRGWWVAGRRPESLFRLPLPCGPRARSALPEGEGA